MTSRREPCRGSFAVHRPRTPVFTAKRVGDALFREAGVIEPLVLPHAYSHLAPLVGVA